MGMEKNQLEILLMKNIVPEVETYGELDIQAALTLHSVVLTQLMHIRTVSSLASFCDH